MNDLIIKSSQITEAYRTKHVNLSTSQQIADIGKFSPAKLFLSFRCLLQILKNLIAFRPHLVYLTLAPSGFAFYRDAVYIQFIKLFPTRLVLHLHGQGIRAGARDSRLFRLLCKSIFRKAHVIFLSDRLKEDAIEFVRTPPLVVNNGIPDEIAIRTNAASNNSPVRILYLSNYVRSKGILDLVDALEIVARTHKDFHCDLVGKPFDISNEFLTDYVRQKGLSDKVTVHGARYGEEKTGFLKNADIFILPSYNDAFPLVILEAMKFALPIISTFEGGIPDIVDDTIDGLLIPKRDIGMLSEKITFLLDHPAERVRLGNAARRKFLDKFTLAVFEKNMRLAFDRLSVE
jgi:glycosyltransferase involved in cell wall biosynthesis